MKTATAKLKQLLTSPNIDECDLYELRLASGQQFFWTGTDKDVWVGDRCYPHDGPVLKREQVKINSSVVVDTLNVTMYADAHDNIGVQTVLQAAHSGALDGAILTLSRCFFDADQVSGMIQLFSGNVEINSAGGMTIKMVVKAKTQGLNMEFPIRRYYPQGTYQSTNGSVVADAQSDSTCLIAPYVPRREVLM